MLPQMVLAIESMVSSTSTPAARTIEFLGGEMSLLVTVEIVLAPCLVLAASAVETDEHARFGAGSGVGRTVFVAALRRGIDGGGVVNVYVGQGIGRDG